MSEHHSPAAHSPAAAPSGPVAGEAERFAAERRLRIEVETMPDGRRLRYVSREPERGSPNADDDDV